MAPEGSTPNGGETEEREPLLTGTSAALFPDLNDRYMEETYGKAIDPQAMIEEQEKVEATEKETAQPDEKTTPDIEDVLDTEAFGNKKVRVKVDGVESEVTLKELLKGYQLEQHLTRKGQKLSEKERALNEAAELLASKVSTPKATPQAEEDPLDDVVGPYVKPLKQEIEDLRKTIKKLEGATQPLEYQQNLKRVDAYLRQEGYEDFMAYVPRIEQTILEMSVEKQAEQDNPLAFMNLYKDLKIRDLKKPPGPKTPDERPKPKVSTIKVEPAGGVDSSVDDKAVKDKALFDRARESGKTEDWEALFVHRGI